MKITQVVPSLEPQQGGTSVSVPKMSEALARLGHEVTLLATKPGAGAARQEGSLEVEIFPRGFPQRICPSPELRERLEQRDAQIIHHHSLWLRTLHYAHDGARAHGAKFIVSPRGMMNAWAWRHRFWRKLLARTLIHPGALAAVDGWHATSEEEAAEIKSLGFTQPVCVAPNGVNAPQAPARARAIDHWRAKCPALGDRPVALFYSRFHQKKRVLELIDLWLKVAPRDWVLLLVGIPQEYTPAMLEQHVERASGTGRVHVFSGADQPPPYAVASLFLLPSHSENFGLVIAEAMAHGVPALVTDGTPWSALNLDGRGWCVPWSDYGRALQSATTETPEQLRARGARARDWVVTEYAWEKSAETLAEFYRTLLNSG
jgi:glycosyltransferase involved in cell wall biosynthesis